MFCRRALTALFYCRPCVSRAGARHYLNHLPVINEAIGGGAGGGGSNNDNNNDPSSSSAFEGSGGVLFQFEADPPTVTMQVCIYCLHRPR